MFLLIDDRAGSKEFASQFEENEFALTRLEFGDIAFSGNGPDGTVDIGIEHKQVSDAADCVTSGRFTGTQLPGMVNVMKYFVNYLIIEGIYQPDPFNGKLCTPCKRRNGGNSIEYGISFASFDNWQNTLSVLCGVQIKHAKNKFESANVIRALYNWWQTPWDKHKSHMTPDRTQLIRAEKTGVLIRINPGDSGYPKYILRKTVFQVDGFGWDMAGLAATKFGTLEMATAASQKDWESIDGIGKILARRAFESFHGYVDPNVPIKKGKK